MAEQGGQLLISRQRITLPPGETDVITGIREPQRSGTPDPGIYGTDPVGETPGVPSRVMVMPEAPYGEWLTITHGEPHEGAGGAVVVTFTNSDDEDHTIVVLFWDPHTAAGPVSADTYTGPPTPPPDCDLFTGCFAISASVVANGTT